jgi:hypothetical protein
MFDVVLVNQSRVRAGGDTYVIYDKSSFADIAVPIVVDDFESSTSPGKHDGAKVVQTILDLYDARPALI